MTTNPAGVVCVNMWRAPARGPAPADWEKRAEPFVRHIKWLWGAAAEAFLDWLAHIEQKPGELPHFGWLHICRSHGMGRNWVAGVLTRVWPRHVAPAFDLVPTLESGFNGRLSRCHLAIVDEIHEGGTMQWKHASALRQLLTADQRLINPKFGRQRVEVNVCRWLMFSNEIGALPLDEKDRRLWVVDCTEAPRPESHYRELYGQLSDRHFIASVAHLLSRRDISKFNPGQRPPMTAAKAAMVDASRSDADRLALTLVRNWPVDVIWLSAINSRLQDDKTALLSARALAHSLDRAGIRRWPRASGKLRSHLHSSPETAYIIRNFSTWATADAEALRNECGRVSESAKADAMLEETAPPPETCFRSRSFPTFRGSAENLHQTSPTGDSGTSENKNNGGRDHRPANRKDSRWTRLPNGGKSANAASRN